MKSQGKSPIRPPDFPTNYRYWSHLSFGWRGWRLKVSCFSNLGGDFFVKDAKFRKKDTFDFQVLQSKQRWEQDHQLGSKSGFQLLSRPNRKGREICNLKQPKSRGKSPIRPPNFTAKQLTLTSSMFRLEGLEVERFLVLEFRCRLFQEQKEKSRRKTLFNPQALQSKHRSVQS